MLYAMTFRQTGLTMTLRRGEPAEELFFNAIQALTGLDRPEAEDKLRRTREISTTNYIFMGAQNWSDAPWIQRNKKERQHGPGTETV